MLNDELLHKIVSDVEALEPDEVITIVVEHGLPSSVRAERLSEIQQVLDELRRRGRSPRVSVHRSDPRAEVHALSLG